MMKIRLGLLAVLVAVSAGADTDPWSAIRYFEGKWEGQAHGEPGKGISRREFRFDLNGRYLVARNRSEYEPKSPGATPEVHEDLGLYSFDKSARKVVLRQFHGEGFVNEYTLESAGADGKSFDFVTVRIENIAPGWRAKESFRILGADEYVETFSLAEPGKDFAVYTETRLKRVK